MILNGRHYRTGEALSVAIEDKRITAITSLDTKEDLPFIGPGLCDLQLNGYDGVDFNGEHSPSREDLLKVRESYLKEGCTAFLPTMITNDVGAINQRISAFEALRANPVLAATIAGYHIEGPFISPKDGARGAHPLEFVRKPDLTAITLWQETAQKRVKILTLSPEWENANEVIAQSASLGICISVGHTMASAEQITSATRSGASMVTHFGNGVPMEVPRHPNFLWQELAEDGLSLGVIADGFHLPDAVLKTVAAVKQDKFFLVSDSTAFGGMKSGNYQTHIGGKVTLSSEGRLHLTDNPSLLAGSAQSLRHGVEHMVKKQILTLGEAWEHASSIPARLIGVPEIAALALGAWANLALYRFEKNRLHIETVYHQGLCAYKQ